MEYNGLRLDGISWTLFGWDGMRLDRLECNEFDWNIMDQVRMR